MSLQLTSPRLSIQPSNFHYYNKLLHACNFSSKVYRDSKLRDVVLYKGNKSLYVTFKGCSTFNDFLTSADIRSCRIHGEKVGIHNGFCEKHKGLHDNVIYDVLDNCMSGSISDVIFTGHSAGGSVAQICSVFMHDIISDGVTAHCYTFGSPKVGDEAFKDAIESTLKDKLVRMETYNDIVCLLPMQSSFEHAGRVLVLDNGSVYENGLEFYQEYHKDYLNFVSALKKNNLMNKKDIVAMIDDHSCESYTNNIYKLIKGLKKHSA